MGGHPRPNKRDVATRRKAEWFTALTAPVIHPSFPPMPSKEDMVKARQLARKVIARGLREEVDDAR